MDLEVVILTEVSQTEKGKYHMISLICGIQNHRFGFIYKTEFIHLFTNEFIYKTEI